MKTAPVPRQRRHTLYFLGEIRAFAPVFLDTEVDMTRVLAHRAAAAAAGTRYSVVTYVVSQAAQALAAHPDANAAVRGRAPRLRVAHYDTVNVKLTLDKVIAGRRVVMAALLPSAELCDLGELQRQVDHYRDGDPGVMPEFAPTRSLHQLPGPVGAALFKLAARPLRRRALVLGTLAVTSLGHAPVDGFYSVGGTTITLGAGRVTDRPVVRDGAVVIRPQLRMCLTFDHRVIDGAEAADLLADIKRGLEEFGYPGPEPAGPAEVAAAEAARV
jgi:pyruvate/2-oxoglutarate dehydrogenase complex dihydrolipoamide acyltransferase (E2) component